MYASNDICIMTPFSNVLIILIITENIFLKPKLLKTYVIRIQLKV